MESSVLLFGLSPMEAAMVKHTLSGLRIAVLVPEKAQYTQPIGSFVSGKPAAAPTIAFRGELEEPVVVLCNLSNDEQDQVLADLRKAGLCTGALKAILTSVNQYWNVIMLLDELRRERAIMSRQRKK